MQNGENYYKGCKVSSVHKDYQNQNELVNQKNHVKNEISILRRPFRVWCTGSWGISAWSEGQSGEVPVGGSASWGRGQLGEVPVGGL